MCLKFERSQFRSKFLDSQNYQYHDSRKNPLFYEKIVSKNFALEKKSHLVTTKPGVTEKVDFQFRRKSEQKYYLILSHYQDSNERTKQITFNESDAIKISSSLFD